MIFSILIIIVCCLLILVVLVQNSKGGGIQSQFGAATQIMGVKRGTEFIEKATWGLAIVLIILSVLMAPKGGLSAPTSEEEGSISKKIAPNAVAPAPQQQPKAPANQQPH
ncbi:MAG: preprotein translocase subunit SecG [Bacteroidia bacterium]